jgi:hypothetical protein
MLAGERTAAEPPLLLFGPPCRSLWISLVVVLEKKGRVRIEREKGSLPRF